LRNRSFNRNLERHTRLPYRESWYQQDPFTYIDSPSVETVGTGSS
jgi:nitrogenase molybdenum-iron protein alpha chain